MKHIVISLSVSGLSEGPPCRKCTNDGNGLGFLSMNVSVDYERNGHVGCAGRRRRICEREHSPRNRSIVWLGWW